MELHLLLGITNRLLKELDHRLQAVKSCSMRADDWIARLAIQRQPQHGGQLNGNQCAKLLDSVDLLEQMLRNCGAYAGMPVVQAIRYFRRVKETCFGVELQSGYEDAVARFAQAYAELETTTTPKVHALIDHVLPFLLRTEKQQGLGYWSEHSSEAVHHDFNLLWGRSFKVSAANPHFAEQLLKCVIVYCSRHL